MEDGSGLWEKLNKTKIKLPITKKQVEGVKHALTKGTRDNWPPQSRTLFAKYGDRKVLPSSFVACRYPISTNEMVKNVANLLGRKVPHDDLFHLQILFSVEGAPELALDKNEDMRLRTAKHKRAKPEMECIPLQYNGPAMTLNEMVDNTMKLMGKEKFFSYSSFLNNCQDFVLNFMKANQLSGDMAWIKQDIADLLPKWAKKLADVGTNFKNIQKMLVEGKGNKSGGGNRRTQAINRANELYDIYIRGEFNTENENMLRRISSIISDLSSGNRQVKENAIERLAEIDTYRTKSANKRDPYDAPSRGNIDGDGISGSGKRTDMLYRANLRVDEAFRFLRTLPRSRKRSKLWVLANDILNAILYGDVEEENRGLTALTHLEEKIKKLRRERDGTDSDSDGEAAPRSGRGILENYSKLNPFSGTGFFDELAKMRTPEGQDRSYCSRSFANVRFTKGGKEKAMTSCMAKRKKERESKTEGNGIPLVALTTMARQFRGHL
jgi:hypothetical protein